MYVPWAWSKCFLHVNLKGFENQFKREFRQLCCYHVVYKRIGFTAGSTLSILGVTILPCFAIKKLLTFWTSPHLASPNLDLVVVTRAHWTQEWIFLTPQKQKTSFQFLSIPMLMPTDSIIFWVSFHLSVVTQGVVIRMCLYMCFAFFYLLYYSLPNCCTRRWSCPAFW